MGLFKLGRQGELSRDSSHFVTDQSRLNYWIIFHACTHDTVLGWRQNVDGFLVNGCCSSLLITRKENRIQMDFFSPWQLQQFVEYRDRKQKLGGLLVHGYLSQKPMTVLVHTSMSQVKAKIIGQFSKCGLTYVMI